MIRRLFWDLEVSKNIGTFWRVGRKISVNYHDIIKERAIISVAWKWEHERKVHALHWDENQSDKGLVKAFVPVLNSADESVAHFGDGFDLKWMKGRALIHGIQMLPKYRSVDTCKIARKNFLLNSYALDYLAQLLGVGAKIHTKPGLWERVMFNKCEKSLAWMVRYNKVDVKILEAVFHKMELYAPPMTHVAVLNGGDKWQCPYCESENVKISKTRVTAAGTKQFQMQCSDCGGYYSVNERTRGEYLEFKRKRVK